MESNKKLKDLREKIKRRYNDFHLNNRDQFPLIEYNTNRKNYEPLRDCFEIEFFVNREIDRINNNLHIPSTNTFVLLFTDDNYKPSLKILNTCESFTESPINNTLKKNEFHETIENFKKNKSFKNILHKNLLTILIFFFILILGVFYTYTLEKNNRLIIDRPIPFSTVSRKIIVEGTVKNSDTVWVVIRPSQSNKYWVQPPIIVKSNGVWKGEIYIGKHGQSDDIGQWFQIKALVAPNSKLFEGKQLNNWPNAKLSTDIIEVLRGS